MKVEPQGPLAWASFVNQVLDHAFGEERYPVSVMEVAQTLTPRLFPDDPITVVEGAAMDGLDGILVPDPQGRKGWGIFFNSSVPSRRRIRFTLGHELGHYLMHRRQRPEGFRCGNREMPRGASRIEEEADTFSANFLMPVADFQRQIAPGEWTDLAMLSCCADRYGVSLQAAVRQWLRLTTRRAVMVVSQDGFIAWSEASEAARRSGRFIQSHRKPPVEIPTASLAARPGSAAYPREGVPLPKGTWFPDEGTVEMAVFYEQDSSTLSLLHLDIDAVEA